MEKGNILYQSQGESVIMTKCDEIAAVLRKELISGKYMAGSQFPSEQKLMHRFNASRITVNKVTSLLVSEGYILRGRKGSGTLVNEYLPFPAGTFAYVGAVNNDYSIQILDSLQYNAFQKGYALSIFSPGSDLMQYCIDRIRCSSYLGLFVSGIGVLSSVYKLPFPVVYLDNGLPGNSIPRHSVICNNVQGAADMAEAVWEHGHRQILIFTSYSIIEYSREQRINAFVDTLLKHGLSEVKSRIVHFEAPLQQNAQISAQIKKALKRFPDTTAFLTDSDHVALFLLKILREMGLSDQITVTGFGALSKKQYHSPKIPTVDQHPEEIASAGFQKMLRILESPEAEPPSEIVVETELIHTELIRRIL